ncbi:MAG: hypothetical protein ACYC9J_14585 [Sulfuricaulis sp.]
MLRLTVNCYSDNASDLPVCALVNIDEIAMTRIRLFAAFVETNSLYRVERFDYSPTWYYVSVDENEHKSGESSAKIASVECGCLNVAADSFWWSAFLKNSNIEIETEKTPISPQKDRLVA